MWVCLCTCLVSCAIHLETIEDMTAELFLLAFRRFVSLQGTPTEVLSDNASQLMLAADVVFALWNKVLTCEGVYSYSLREGIKWTFIVEVAPWMGGFYKRLVGLVKRALRKSIWESILSAVKLQTLLKEIEAVVNGRPLVYVGDDIRSDIPLCPSHFLTLNPKTGVPDFERDNRDEDYQPYKSSANRLIKLWKKGQRMCFGKCDEMTIY